MYEILLGIPAMFPPKDLVNEKGLIIDKTLEEDDEIWCDFEVGKNLQDNTYYVEFETMLGFERPNSCRDWIVNCLSYFTNYMDEHSLDKSKELDMYSVFTDGINVNTKFKSIEEAYAYMKFVVFGFHGQGL